MTTRTVQAILPLVDKGEERLALFGHDPVGIVLLKALFIFIVLVLLTLFNIWYLRRVMGRMQHRIGPNVHGPVDLVRSLMGKKAGTGTGLQTLADGVKLAFKEDVNPKAADKIVFFLAPILIVVPAFVTWAVIPFGPVVNFFGHQTPLQLTDTPVAVLLVLAIASIGAYGFVLAGWSSGSTYPLLGGLRSTAQVISYEIAMGLSLVAVFLYAGSMSTSEIVEAQKDIWFAALLLPSLVIYFISMVGETNNIPFDLPEAEGELVGGYMTEYSSLKFALFFLAEFINKITASALIVTLFLGGWRAPWPISLWEGANEGYWPLIWFFAKVYLFVFDLRLADGLAAARPLRPVHAPGLEGPHPDLAAVDHRRAPRSARSPARASRPTEIAIVRRRRAVPGGAGRDRSLCDMRAGPRGRRRDRDRGRGARAVRRVRRRLPRAPDARGGSGARRRPAAHLPGPPSFR